MRSIIDLDIPIILDTSSNNLTEDFFKPLLSHSINYDRGVGYFTSGWLRINAIGMSSFAENGGHARWITSPILEEKDWNALKSGEEAKENIIAKNILRSSIPDIKEGLEIHTLSTLAWLIADEIIEFKIAIPRNNLLHGEFHDKFGVFYDSYGNSICFSGSYNDSIQGTLNYESIKVFKSWIPEYKNLVISETQRFNDLWNNQDKNIQVYDLPSAVKEEIIKFRKYDRPYKISKIGFLDFLVENPEIPKNIKLRNYQNDAIEAWINNDFHGIYEMATGTGKTITALSSSIRLLKEINHLFIIISCPFQHLVVQWGKEAEKFGFFPITAFDNKNIWFDNLNEKIIEFNHNDINDVCVVSTYDTFMGRPFQESISRVDGPLLIIGDEVHHLGTEKSLNLLPSNVEYRLGLSATPSRWYDEKGTKGILNYFGEVVFEFSLSKAIKEGYLTQYYYHPKIVELTEDEILNYEHLSKKIGALLNMGVDDDEALLRLLIKRSEILQTAENKITTILDIVDNIQNLSHALFYCAPGQINQLLKILGRKKHLRVHRFTYHENHSLRKKLLKDFDNGVLQALLAIKCLDEGVDIPSTKTAFFLSSSSNPREFVQRRGRILRKYPNKEFAEIYDLIVAPPYSTISDSEIERNILRKEFRRFKEFAENAINMNSAYDVIWKLSESYGIYDL